MARSMSSRFLFTAGCSFTDLESPRDHDTTPEKTKLIIPFPLFKLSTRLSLLLSFLLLFLCYQTRSLHCSILCILLIIVSFLFKNKARLILVRFFNKKKPTFFIGDEDAYTKKSRKQIRSPGVRISSGGTVYAGEFYNGSCTGKGVIQIPEKSTYVGDWIDGVYDGYGVERLVGCGEYKGKFWKGMRHGFGSMMFRNGDRYNGEWRYGERDGIGQETFADGTSYRGRFKKGMKHGVGIYCFRNGDVYRGEYFGDKLLGFGLYDFSNGDCYHGSWHDDQMAGYGIYTKRDGEVLSGMWVGGSLVTLIPPAFPCIQNSVKAARKAAQRSRSLPREEYHVCQAVYEACKAAKAARLISIAICKEHELHYFNPIRLVLWMHQIYADRLNGESQVKRAKKGIKELSYCLKSSSPSIRTAFLAFRRFSGRCRPLAKEGEQVYEEYLVPRPDSGSMAETCSFLLSPKKSK